MTKVSATARAVLLKKNELLARAIEGRESASSTSLSRSYDLPIGQVQTILRSKGVKDDG